MQRSETITLSGDEFRRLIHTEVKKALKLRKPIKKKMLHGISELAKFLRVSEPTAQKMIRQNIIKGFKEGRTYIFDPDSIIKAIFKNSK